MNSIAFVLGSTGQWGAIDPSQPFAKPLGGRETAAVRLSQELAKRGWSVGLFSPRQDVELADGVLWLPCDDKLPKGLANFEVVCAIDDPTIFDKVKPQLALLHSQYADIPGWQPRFAHKIDHYMFLSQYQQNAVRDRHPEIDPEDIVVVGNGVDLERYALELPPVPGRLVWSSSPDRGLHHLLRWWPDLKGAFPHLSLQIFYNLGALEPYRWTQECRAEWARSIAQGAMLPGVEVIGPVDQATLARAQKQAELFVYPCDPAQPTETYCITALEMAAAGVPMLLSDADCLGEIYGDVAWFIPAPPRDDLWLVGIGQLLSTEHARTRHVAAARALAEKQTWEQVAGCWDYFLRNRLALSDRATIVELVENTTYRVALPLGEHAA